MQAKSKTYGMRRTTEYITQLGGINIADQIVAVGTEECSVSDDACVLYPSPYIVLTEKQYTKHYYMGSEKIATMIGDGGILLETNHLSNEQRSLINDGFYRTFEPTAFQYDKTPNIDIQGMHTYQLEYKCGCIEQVYLYLMSFNPMLEPMMTMWQNSNGCKNEIYYTHSNHLGSASWITDVKGNPIQYIHYAPYGELIANKQTIGYDERFKFTGKERDWETGYDYFGARFYDFRKGFWNSVDPLADKYPNVTPYLYCNGNPIMLVDPDGRDTINLIQNNNIWSIKSTSIARGNDVFNLTYQDGTSSSYEFSEGEYGERVSCLNIENTGKGGYTLGVYHVSGAIKGGTGFYVTPGGDASNKLNSNKRILDGSYPINMPFKNAEWRYPGIGGSAVQRGTRFHYSGSKNPLPWTKGCFVLFPNYSFDDRGQLHIDPKLSIEAAINFAHLMGGVGVVHYSVTKKGQVKNRIGVSDYPYEIKDRLYLK